MEPHDHPRVVNYRKAAHGGAKRVSVPWTIAAAAVSALVVGAASFAASSAPPYEARALGELYFGKNMARAEVVMVNRAGVHDYRIDQGKVVASRVGSVELLERDGTRQVIPLAPTVAIWLNGRPSTLLAVPLRMNAVTIRDGDQPAAIVRITGSLKKP
jgi:hypothetical protein